MVMVGQLHASPALPHRTSPRYPWNRRLCWSKIQYGRCGERSSSLPPPVIEARFPGCRHCPNCRRPWTRHQCSTVYAAEAIHSSERPWCCCSAAVPQVGLVGAPKLNWKARSKLPLYAPMFDLILRENGGRSFCFQNAAFSIQTIPPSLYYWPASAWSDGSTRSFPTCIKGIPVVLFTVSSRNVNRAQLSVSPFRIKPGASHLFSPSRVYGRQYWPCDLANCDRHSEVRINVQSTLGTERGVTEWLSKSRPHCHVSHC